MGHMPRRQHRLTVCWSNAMFGGKTEEAGLRATIAHHSGRNWILVRPRVSRRGNETDNTLVTHGGREFHALSTITAKESIDSALALVEAGADLVWIDEPFLWPDKEDIAEAVFALAEHSDVIVSTLARTSEGDWWPAIGEILSKADDIIDCKRAVCNFCKSPGATRTVYVGNDEKSGKDKVGGAESYQPACVSCWNRMTVKE